ncbi:hypothetical protein K6U70_07740, partial [Vibrio vulnificus]|uniref:hypothetical protein n=1 Tax=Vibrio vulnificus TaxID=672 RepID=UPI001EECD8A6
AWFMRHSPLNAALAFKRSVKELMKDIITSLLPVLSLIAGWGLNEYSQKKRSNAEYQASIAKVLSILLEVRHKLNATEFGLQKLKELGFPSELIPQIRDIAEQFIPDTEGLSADYNQALGLLAQRDPVLAFRFRSQDSVNEYLKMVRNISKQNEFPIELAESMESSFKNILLPNLNDLIRELAKIHSRSTSKEVDEILAKKPQLPAEFVRLLSELGIKS